MTYNYRDILSSELLVRKKANPKFSLRAFARHLGLSPGHLSSLIHGKRNLTGQQAEKLISKLELSPGDKKVFLSSAFPGLLDVETVRERNLRLLQEDEFILISEWFHFAILSLGEIAGNKAQPGWIAERLGISELQARDALNRLGRLGLISVKNDGSFKQTGEPLTTSDDIPSGAIKSFHRKTLDLAKSKLDSVPVGAREFGSVTMAINPAKVNRAKQLIREFQDRLSEELEVGRRKTSVYTLSMQFFPLTAEMETT